MKKCCKGESSAHSIPRTRFTNLLGSDRDKELRSSSEVAECNNEALTEESAGQRMIKCDGSSGSCPHNRQVGSCLWQLVNRLWRKRQASSSRPWQLTRSLMRKLFSLVREGRP